MSTHLFSLDSQASTHTQTALTVSFTLLLDDSLPVSQVNKKHFLCMIIKGNDCDKSGCDDLLAISIRWQKKNTPLKARGVKFIGDSDETVQTQLVDATTVTESSKLKGYVAVGGLSKDHLNNGG